MSASSGLIPRMKAVTLLMVADNPFLSKTAEQGNNMKKSFILYCDTLAVLDHLTDEQAGQLFKAIKSYQSNKDTELDPIIRVAFTSFEAHFVRDDEKYNHICERNRVNGAKGGRPKEPKEPSGLSGNPKNLDSDSDSDSDTKKNSSRFTPPTTLEIQQYISEKQYTVDAERFFNFYESKNWMIGKNKMKKWKAAVANWEKSDKGNGNGKTGKNSSERFMENLRDIGGY